MTRRTTPPQISWLILAASVLGTVVLLELVAATRVGWTAATITNGAARGLSFRGVELELLWIVWFMLVVAVELAARRASEQTQHRLRFHLFLLSVLALGMVFWIAADTGPGYLYAWQYLVASASIGFLFLLTAMVEQAPMREVARGLVQDGVLMARRLTTWAILAGVLVLVVSRPAQANRTVSRPDAPMGEDFVKWFVAQPRQSLPVSSPRAVVIARFNDYQCPACRTADDYYAPVFAELDRTYPGAIQVVSYDFPLETECNAKGSELHAGACEAAVAVRLARQAGREVEMERWLWANQRSLSRETIFRQVDAMGIGNIRHRYDSIIREVRADADIGLKAGVKGTPTFFVNGVKMSMVPAQNLRAVVAHELRAAGVIK